MSEETQQQKMDRYYKMDLPESLYLSHYELAHRYPIATAQEWRVFVRDNATFIDAELAAIAEAEARSALQKLGKASGQEVTALKTLLDRSKIINDAQKQSTKIVFTFIPATQFEEKTE